MSRIDQFFATLNTRRPAVPRVLRTPPLPGAHQHYTELRRCRSCGTLQMVNVGPSGEHEASAWFRAAEDCMPWQGLHDAAIAAGSPIGRD